MKHYRALIVTFGVSWLALAGPACADDGYDLWLRAPKTIAGQAAVTATGDSATLRLAADELRRALPAGAPPDSATKAIWCGGSASAGGRYCSSRATAIAVRSTAPSRCCVRWETAQSLRR